jgi:hypothetical protein
MGAPWHQKWESGLSSPRARAEAAGGLESPPSHEHSRRKLEKKHPSTMPFLQRVIVKSNQPEKFSQAPARSLRFKNRRNSRRAMAE